MVHVTPGTAVITNKIENIISTAVAAYDASRDKTDGVRRRLFSQVHVEVATILRGVSGCLTRPWIQARDAMWI
jgi:hypothetical protein